MNLWRGYTEHGMRAQVYSKISLEYQAERERIEVALLAIKQENRECIANLDPALTIIAEIGERYVRQDETQQRNILRQIVSKVVIGTRGTILRLELQPPFTYLKALAQRDGLQNKREKEEPPSIGGKSSQNHAGCSLPVGFSTPSRTRTYAHGSEDHRSIH